MSFFTIDYFQERSHHAEPGDLLLGPNVVHRVTAVRPVESRVWHDRWRLTIERVGRRQEIGLHLDTWRSQSIDAYGSCVVMEPGRYERGEGPRDFARKHHLPIDEP